MASLSFGLMCLLATQLTIANGYVAASEWYSGISLPRNQSGMAVGASNGSIYLLGGYTDTQQMYSYSIEEDSFEDFGTVALPVETYGYGQYWTQIDDTVFMVGGYQSLITSFNMTTKTFNPLVAYVPFEVYTTSCLTSTQQYLFVVGGDDSNKTQHIGIGSKRSVEKRLTWL